MKRFYAPMLGVLALAACSDSSTSPAAPSPESLQAPQAPVYSKGAAGIEGDYIVVFTDDVAEPLGKADEKLRTHGGVLKYKYSAAVKGYAATLSVGALAALRADPDVAYIEQDGIVTADATQYMDAAGDPWGLDRIDQRSNTLTGSYTYTATASAVRAYIIDTGLQTDHPQFGSRALSMYNAISGETSADCNGHGTHVGGTVGGSTYGVAKAVLLRGVKVLNCAGSGSNSGVVAGIDWVRINHVKPAVANMSLGGGYSATTNTAVNNLAAAGVFIAVAAGNENQDACNVSPASAANATTVAASTKTNAKASYSNYGACVDLYAPGSAIKSAWINSGTNTISGTSMASPHVAGVGALYKATYGDASYSTIRSWLTTNATANVISGNVGSTPNKLLYKATL